MSCKEGVRHKADTENNHHGNHPTVKDRRFCQVRRLNFARKDNQSTCGKRDNLNEQMLLELAQAANNLDEAQLECEIAERSLAQADENRRVSRSQYEAGMESLSDHLEAQTLWQQAWQTHVESRYQLYLKYIAYQKAAGEFKINE